MIQRIQSLFLAGVIICMIALMFVPIWREQSKNTTNPKTAELTVYTLKSSDTNADASGGGQNTIYLAAIALLVAGIAAYELISYKNRIRQRQLGGINSILMICLLGATYYLIYTGSKMISSTGQDGFELGFFLITIAIILNILANKFILRDERLVKSADRMRD